MTLPPALHEYLSDPTLEPVWRRLRDRLERTGHAVSGRVRVELDPVAAERLSGLLGRPVVPGARQLALADVDDALIRSDAGRGLVSVLAELTGGPLRDRPSEKRARADEVSQLFARVDEIMATTGLVRYPWAREWIAWLHASGLLVRAGTVRGTLEFDTAATALALVLDGGRPARMLGELASQIAGDAHALDNDRLAGRLAVRALSLATGSPEPATARERMALWESHGVTVDAVSATVLTWGLRPPGQDRWSAMMRDRADQGLVTHLTIRELIGAPAALTLPDVVVSGCENPQVLQRIADAEIDRPVVCFSGNPSLAGRLLAGRVALRYHGDFDWPGIAIASRVIAAGAQPWRFGARDYLDALDRSGSGLTLAGSPVATPWDPDLETTMVRVGLAVHEESVVDRLTDDLREHCT